MGTPRIPSPVKLVVGVLASSQTLIADATATLCGYFGEVDACSPIVAWSHSDYYHAEMGERIERQFLSFARLIEPQSLATLKLTTNELECRWRTPTGRCVNLDPGYVAATKLVLASTKDAGSRVYLGQGVFAEVTLHFRSGSYAAHPFTYRDYAAPQALEFFNSVRRTYLMQLRRRSS